MRIPHIKLSDNFLGTHGLQYKPEHADFRGVKSDIKTQPAYASIAKSVDVDKGTFQTVLGNILQVTGELLSEAAMVDVDLGELGKFVSSGGQLIYCPYNKLKPAPPQGKQTVKALMDFGPTQQQQMMGQYPDEAYYYSQQPHMQ